MAIASSRLAPRAGLLLLLIGALACERGADAARKPEGVILLSLDTLRADHLGPYGYERASPALAGLAAEGILFEHAVAAAGSTRPSHMALFQSRIPSRTDPKRAMLAERLAARGIRTAAFTGGGYVGSRFGFARGFARFEEDRRLSTSLEKASAWLRDNADTPFFLFLHTYDIHLPYDPPPPYDAMFGGDYTGPVEGKSTRSLLRRIRGFDTVAGEGPPMFTPADRQRTIDLYDGGIRWVDDQLGRFFAELKRTGIWDQVVIVVLSDHGEEFWEHGSVSHARTLYQEILHVPLIWKLPGGRGAGTRVAATVPLIDVVPTILALLDLPLDDDVEGQSLLAMMSSAGGTHRDAVSQLADAASLVRYPWKLVDASGGPSLELYDLRDDPGERRNRASEKPHVVRDLRDRLDWAAGAGGRAVNDEKASVDAATRERLRELGYGE